MRRWWLLGLLAIAVLAIGYLIFLIVYWPFTEQSLIDVLQERSVRSVTIDHFHQTYWPPGCVAEGISFLHRKHKEKAPLITIQKLVIKSSYTGLIFTHSLSKVVAVGMHVTVPPSNTNGGPNPIMPLTQSNTPGSSLVIGRLVADGAVLDFMSNDPQKKPFHLVINRLAIDGVGNNKPLSYRATITNTLPPGKIESSGVFGPWNADKPASTPVKGSYTYQNANLAVFQDLSGTLFSSGKFSGKLGQMEVDGTARVPNFHLKDTSHTRLLNTEFQAEVDGTNGNTTLKNVIAHFDRTLALFKGTVKGRPGGQGKTVSLDLFAPHGRIEDLLDLFIAAKLPPMTGAVSLQAHLEVPPGTEPFVKRLQMTGDFGVDAGKFTNQETQDSINRLSEGSTNNKKAEQENVETVMSDLKGHAALRDGIANFAHLSFRVPGATAWMQGTYGLTEPYPVDLHGKLLTDHPSAAGSGFTSFLLKAMTPFLKKRHGEKVLPFKMTGTYQKIAIGLDLTAEKK